jgi:hypothetical protein
MGYVQHIELFLSFQMFFSVVRPSVLLIGFYLS